jgi:transcriptional regulator with XRE-family HTH domain
VIKDARERAGLGRSEVARRVGCTRQHLANVELGHRSAGPALAIRLADVLDLTAADLAPDPTTKDSA